MREVFETAAFVLTPADPSRTARVVLAEETWRFDVNSEQDADVLIWGRPPTPSGGPRWERGRAAAARGRALRSLRRQPPAPYTVADVHRWPPPDYGNRVERWLRAAVMSGALVELVSAARPARVIDVCARAAGALGAVSMFRPGSGGSVVSTIRVAPGHSLVLRVGRTGGAGDPTRGYQALERMADAGVAGVPSPSGHGHALGASWTVESLLPGTRPTRLTSRLFRQVARFCAELPRHDASPTAPREDLKVVAKWLPDRRGGILALGDRVERSAASLPGVMRHGDLRSGNLLTRGSRLTGVIDWDPWAAGGMPGADLLHLLATDEAVRTRRSVGAMWLTRPWRSSRFLAASDAYWGELGIRPDQAALDAVGISWWAATMRNYLDHLPHLASDEPWVGENIDAVLTAQLGPSAA